MSADCPLGVNPGDKRGGPFVFLSLMSGRDQVHIFLHGLTPDDLFAVAVEYRNAIEAHRAATNDTALPGLAETA